MLGERALEFRALKHDLDARVSARHRARRLAFLGHTQLNPKAAKHRRDSGAHRTVVIDGGAHQSIEERIKGASEALAPWDEETGWSPVRSAANEAHADGLVLTLRRVEETVALVLA